MLETMRRNSRSAIIYVLFGILIAVFVISFGPGSRGFSAPSASSNMAAVIDGTTLTELDFRFAYLARGGAQMSGLQAKEGRLKEQVMDDLIERTILASDADKLGFRVSQKEAEDLIASGQMILLGRHVPMDRYVFKDGKFDYERFRLVAQNQLGVSVLRYIEIEEREMLADKFRQMFESGLRVSSDEVKTEFGEQGLQVNLEYVRFSTRRPDDTEPTDAEIDAYAKAHEADLKKTYDERKQLLYTNLEPQARLRHVLVEVDKDAPADAVAKAKAQIDAAKKQIDDGAAFAQVASSASTSELAKQRHGELSWKKKGGTGFGDALDAKVFAASAKKGDVIGPERTERGFELVLVEGKRSGDLSYAQAAPELAAQALVQDRAKEKARAEAQSAIDRAKKGEKLEVMFPVKDDKSDSAQPGPQPDAPALKETGLFVQRGDLIQGLGVSKDLAKQAFTLPVGQVAGPFEVSGAYVVVRVKEHKEPDWKDFDKRKPELAHEAEQMNWFEAVRSYAHERCVDLAKAGRIKVNQEIMTYDLPQGMAKLFGSSEYEPCMTYARE